MQVQRRRLSGGPWAGAVGILSAEPLSREAPSDAHRGVWELGEEPPRMLPMAGARRSSRLAVAKWAVATLAPRVQAEGLYHVAQPHMPAYYLLTEAGCNLLLAPNVLRLPDDPEASMLLDVSMEHGGKVMSVSWFPSQLWMPPHISAMKAGDWMERLGWRGQS